MAAVTIRNLDDDVKRRLQVRAAENGRSMEAEAREILTAAVARPEEAENLGIAIYEAFREFGGVDLVIPARTDMGRPPPDFSDM